MTTPRMANFLAIPLGASLANRLSVSVAQIAPYSRVISFDPLNFWSD